ncbi:MAG: copper resistance protein B [Sulfurifustis sp.]
MCMNASRTRSANRLRRTTLTPHTTAVRSAVTLCASDLAFRYLQAGLRYDSRPEPSRRFAVLGVQGLAPYGFDIEANVSWSSPDGGCGFSDN